MSTIRRISPGSWRSLAVTVIALLLIVGAVAPLAGTATAATESEPNDSLGEAQTVSTGTQVTGDVSASDDDDWFEFTATRGETIEISGMVEQRSGGFDGGNVVVEIVDATGDPIDKNRVGGGSESFTIGTTVVTGGTYYVHVEPEFGGFAADYNFTARTFSTDTFEPNEDRDNATGLTVGVERRGELTVGDDDWFEFTATRGETIEISGTIEEQPGGFVDGDVLVNLVRANGDEITDHRVRGGDAPESYAIGTTVVTGGTYYVYVEQGFGGFAADYNVTANTYRTDSFEPNENRSMAAPLFENPFTPTEAQISLGDADWFAYSLAAGETVRINATAGMPGADQELRIYDPSGDEVNETVLNPGTTDTVVWTAATNGVHNLVIAPQFGGTADYNATMTVDGEPIGPPNDRFERPNPPTGNQDRATATSIGPGTYTDLGMVDDDRDVFAVDLDSGEELNATIEFTHAENDLGLALTDGSGTTLDSSDTGTDGERVGATARSAGTYYLEVTGQAGASTTYDLNLTTTSESSLPTVAQPYDRDTNDEIDLTELGRAARDFANGDLTLTELGGVARAFANT